jgi:formylglycine-generating enzyme required for sulfatase activity
MKICVTSRTGRGGTYHPHVFYLGSRRHPVVTVLAQWTEAQYRCFKVRVADGRHFVLRHDPATGAWELAAAYGGAPGFFPGRAAMVRL